MGQKVDEHNLVTTLILIATYHKYSLLKKKNRINANVVLYHHRKISIYNPRDNFTD